MTLTEHAPAVAGRFSSAVRALTADQYVRLAEAFGLPGGCPASTWHEDIKSAMSACRQLMRAQGEMVTTYEHQRWDLSQYGCVYEVRQSRHAELEPLLDRRYRPGWYHEGGYLATETAVRSMVIATAGALTVRHLIGTTPGWDQAAYDTITRPWRRIVGPAHPDDAPIGTPGGAR